MNRRFLSILLAAALCLGIFPLGALSADLKFVDVSPEAWYYSDVKTAVDAGLVNGKTETTYCPDDFLTYAEAVKLAACMHQKYLTGVVSLVNGDPWYKSYADYAKMNGIISQDYDWNAKATRAGYMQIFAHALPDAALAAKNEVPDGSIPDVPASHPQAAEIYKLYRAGVLEGSVDTYNGARTEHLCKPADNIKRSEVAAILTRMMFVESRKTFSMSTAKQPVAPVITEQPKSVAADVGQPATFKVKAEGEELTYQWYSWKPGTGNWVPVSVNGNADTLIVTAEAELDGCNYQCKVSNAGGSVVSETAILTVKGTDGLKITKQPVDFKMTAATDVPEFTVEWSGGKAPYKLVWHYCFTDISSDTTLTADGITKNEQKLICRDASKDIYESGHTIEIWLDVTDSDGKTVSSGKAKVIPAEGVSSGKLRVTKQPVDYVMTSQTDTPVFTFEFDGGVAPYTVTVHIAYEDTGEDHPFEYENRTQKTMTTTIVSAEDDIYKKGHTVLVWYTVTDAVGAVIYSDDAYVIPYAGTSGPLKIKTQPADVSCGIGETATFRVEAEGGKLPYEYVWCYISSSGVRTFNPSIGTNAVLSFEVEDEISYECPVFCKVTDANGDTVNSDYAWIKRPDISGPLQIVKQPKSLVISQLGGYADFEIVVGGGTKPYHYQWMCIYNGKTTSVNPSLNGASTLSLFMDGQEYWEMEFYCIVTDEAGDTVTSDTVRISRT